MYETDYKNKKIYSETGSKKDEKGRFDWQAVEFYKVNDLVPYGHGEKSVMMLKDMLSDGIWGSQSLKKTGTLLVQRLKNIQ